jgi:hypothetical protein
MIDIRPNLAEAVAFAISLPTDQMHLCAIHPAGNRPVVGRSFPKTESGQAAALRWLTEADRKGYGIYFNANEVKPLGKDMRRRKRPKSRLFAFCTSMPICPLAQRSMMLRPHAPSCLRRSKRLRSCRR